MNFPPYFLPDFSRGTQKQGVGERVLYGRDLCRSGGTGKAEVEKCVVCIPATGLRAREFSRSGAQAKAGAEKVKTYCVSSFS